MAARFMKPRSGDICRWIDKWTRGYALRCTTRAIAASEVARNSMPKGEIVGISSVAAIWIVAVDVLFAGAVSALMAVTVAVFTTGPAVRAGVRESAIVAVARGFRVPREQVTVVVPLQVPWVGVAEISVAPAGRMSVTVTPAASEGPLLVTVMV